MREKIAECITGWGYDISHHTRLCIADSILSLFQEEIERLQPLSDEEIMIIRRRLGGKYYREFELIQSGSQAQLAKTKEDLLKSF